MREVLTHRDTHLPAPRPHPRPGERVVSGRVMYSAAWLNDRPAVRPKPGEKRPERRRPG
jgi:hypothetical protein